MCVSLFGVSGGGSARGEALNIGGDKQLFLGPWAADGRDEFLVETMRNVTMTMNEAHVTGERLIPHDKPWDRFDCWLAVLKDGDLFRMYYGSRDMEALRRHDPYCLILLYAESKDGIHWERPNLRLWEWEGSRDNNILFPNDHFPYVFATSCVDQVFIDPNAKSPDEKYKMFLELSQPREPQGRPTLPSGHYAFCSADAIHWRLMSKERVHTGAGDAKYSVTWDERVGKYVQWSRIKPPDQAQMDYYKERFGVEDAGENVRMIGRAESDDFLRWGEGKVVIAPDEADKAHSPAALTRLDFYGPNIRKYSEAASAYIALPTCHSHWKYVQGPKKPRSFPQTIDVQLATSRDGIQWSRAPGRKPFIRLGPEGSFWSKMIFPSGDIVRVGDELWLYFAGLPLAHNQLSNWTGAISRAVLRLDGFIAADAAYTGGELVTRPLVLSGSKLQLNVATGSGGTVQVEIQDEAGKPIQGYALDDADEISGNYIRILAMWRAEQVGKLRREKGDTDVTALAGRPVRLRFVMRDAKLYSFQFVP